MPRYRVEAEVYWELNLDYVEYDYRVEYDGNVIEDDYGYIGDIGTNYPSGTFDVEIEVEAKDEQEAEKIAIEEIEYNTEITGSIKGSKIDGEVSVTIKNIEEIE